MNIFAKLSIVLGALVIALTAFLAGQVNAPDLALGGVAQGTEGSIATTSIITAPSQSAFTMTPGRTATSSACSSRIITTRGAYINLVFATTTSQGVTPFFQVDASNVAGHTQAASTTVVYDSQFYGCGAIEVWSNAAQVITINETQ